MDQGTVDALNGVMYRRDVSKLVMPLFGQHLRYHHGLSRRKTAKALGVSEKWVKENVEESHEGR